MDGRAAEPWVEPAEEVPAQDRPWRRAGRALHRAVSGGGARGGGWEERPYSVRNEVGYFFGKGLPLGAAAMLNYGIPPLVAMVFAGHTPDSARLQASLGYGRTWYNCTVLMPVVAMMAYFGAAVPGCIGAGRPDRIPRYLQRSVLATLLVMAPFYALQFWAGRILAALGIPEANAADVDIYCRLMVVTSLLSIADIHLESAVVNMGYASCASLNSFLSGIGVDIVCTYLFINQWNWGVQGAALAQLSVRLSRVIIWLAIVASAGLFRKLFIPPAGSERLISRSEIREWASLAGPQFLSIYSGWFIFELQALALANIAGITKDALAAGAIWIQFETSVAASQNGWVQTASMRSMKLLGKQDQGTQKAYWIFTALATAIVLFLNVFLLAFQDQLCSLVSNDALVRQWLKKIFWILAVHAQARMWAMLGQMLLVPLKRGMAGTAISFVSFYLVVTPLVLAVALTDLVTTSVVGKMGVVVSGCSIACMLQAAAGFWIMRRMDWSAAAVLVSNRANNDKPQSDPNSQAERGLRGAAEGGA